MSDESVERAVDLHQVVPDLERDQGVALSEELAAKSIEYVCWGVGGCS